MVQQLGNHFDVHLVSKQLAGEGVPQGMDTDVFDAGSPENTTVSTVEISGIHRLAAVMGKDVRKCPVELLKLIKGI